MNAVEGNNRGGGRQQNSSTTAASSRVTGRIGVSRRRLILALTLSFALGAGFSVAFVRNHTSSQAESEGPRHSPQADPSGIRTYADLLTMTPEQLDRIDIAEKNLLCAQGLPGAEDMDIAACRKQLDEWAATIRQLSKERFSVYERDPAKFKNNPNWWRCAALVSFMNQIVGTKYNPVLKARPPVKDKFDTSFFKDAHDCFLVGLLSDRRQGTCSSMPVLVVALGRRLDYPLKLVRGRGHLFCRWDGNNDRFNIEPTDKFAESKPDEFYRTWPVANKEALESEDAVGELRIFLAFRALCQWENRRLREAQVSFAQAHLISHGTGLLEYMEKVLFEERLALMNTGPFPPDAIFQQGVQK